MFTIKFLNIILCLKRQEQSLKKEQRNESIYLVGRPDEYFLQREKPKIEFSEE
jgi:hypothetical protein